MAIPLRDSLTGRLLLIIGLAAVLPLVAISSTILFESYQAIRATTYSAIEKVSREVATEFESRISVKLGEVRGAVLAVRNQGTPDRLVPLLSQDADFSEVWVRETGPEPPHESAHRASLYDHVRLTGDEFLSAPDFSLNQASLGVPINVNGRFAGMVGVSFSLKYFQDIVSNYHLFKTSYASIVSHEGMRIAHPDKSLIGKKIGVDPDPRVVKQMLDAVAAGHDFWVDKKALLTGTWSRQFYSAIRVGTNPAPWFFVIIVPEADAVSEVNGFFLLLIAGLLATLAVVAAATWWATRAVVRPLRVLAAGAEAVAAGQRDARVVWTSRDELGTLAGAFNRMTDQLVTALRDQENLVQERTASLQQSLTDLEATQAQLIEQEKMAVLGQLAARVAHELNTPLGAIRSSSSLVRDGVISLCRQGPGVLRNLDDETFQWYMGVTGQRLNPTLGLPAPVDRTRRRNLSRRLAAGGAEDPDDLAGDIATLGVPDKDEELCQAVDRGLGPLIRRAAQSVTLVQAASIILEAADRATATVAALVNYARVPDIQRDQKIDPAQELETILTLYYGSSRRNVEVVRQFEAGVWVQGDRDKLNQVFTNLVSNALQAMDYHGKLVLRTRRVAEGIEIAVANNGPPVPPDLKAKIFLPFFTTKKPGEGTGLGLDICRRIVGAHHGTLTLSEEGKLTVFAVTLPSP